MALFNTTAGDASGTEAAAFNWDQFWASVGQWLVTNGLKVLVGIVVLIIGFWLINLLAKGVRRAMIKKGIEKTVYTVTHSILRKGLKVALILLFLSFIGVQMTGIAALIASAGLAIGLALQGSLSNFAGGIIILVMRPFKMGDFIEGQGYSGTVEDIHMFYTVLVTPDNKVITLPNGPLSNGAVVNYSTKDLRRVDLTFSIAYDEDFERAKSAIRTQCDANNLVLQNPEPMIRVVRHGASSIDIVTRVWVKNADYWMVNFDLLEAVKRKFDEEGIEIPFPQMDVHLGEGDTKNNTKDKINHK